MIGFNFKSNLLYKYLSFFDRINKKNHCTTSYAFSKKLDYGLDLLNVDTPDTSSKT